MQTKLNSLEALKCCPSCLQPSGTPHKNWVPWRYRYMLRLGRIDRSSFGTFRGHVWCSEVLWKLWNQWLFRCVSFPMGGIHVPQNRTCFWAKVLCSPPGRVSVPVDFILSGHTFCFFFLGGSSNSLHGWWVVFGQLQLLSIQQPFVPAVYVSRCLSNVV